MILKRAQLAAKIEETEGDAQTLAGADAFLAENIAFNPTTAMEQRNNVASSLSPFSQVAGVRSATMEFEVELKGSGEKGTAPALGKLLKACGFGEAVVVSASATYTPASTGLSSLTIGLYNDGVRYQIQGARGNVSLRLEKGKPGRFRFVFTGAEYVVGDVAMLSSGVSYETSKPQPFLSASLSIDSYAALVGLLEFNMGNEVTLRDSVNTASGHLSAVIAGRQPTLSLDPEMVTVATYDWFTKLKTANEGALTATLGATAGNICTISAPKVQYTGIRVDGKSGLRSLGVDCQLNRNAGDDELSIVFT